MAEEEKPATTPEPTVSSPPEFPLNPDDPPPETPTPPAKFDPSRMIGIIKRKALIKDLAAAYLLRVYCLLPRASGAPKEKERAISVHESS
ncbi:unnamed protein product [Brassica oleracea]